MKEVLYILISLTIITACSELKRQENVKVDVKVNPSQNETDKVRYDNPVFIGGSSFGNFFQSLYRLNRFDDMVLFTSKKCRKQFGDNAILGFYQNNFKMDFVLGKLTSIQKLGDTTLLIYSNAHILSRRKFVLETVNEKDSVRLILHSLKNPFQYIIE